MQLGDKGNAVKQVQDTLIKQGFAFPEGGLVPGVFNDAMESVVKYFQSTHVGPGGVPLNPIGVVGPKTTWALNNPSGYAQSSNLGGFHIPNGLTPMRVKIIQVHEAERAAHVHEQPDGSNFGDGIIKYKVPPMSPSLRHAAWCAIYGLWLDRQAGLQPAIDLYKQNPNAASCHAIVNWAKKKGLFYPISSTDPKAWIPGNHAVIFHDAATGHWTTILAVSPDGNTLLTGEGNSGNGVHNRVRHKKEFVGTINMFPDTEQPIDFERYVITGKTSAESDR